MKVLILVTTQSLDKSKCFVFVFVVYLFMITNRTFHFNVENYKYNFLYQKQEVLVMLSCCVMLCLFVVYFSQVRLASLPHFQYQLIFLSWSTMTRLSSIFAYCACFFLFFIFYFIVCIMGWEWKHSRGLDIFPDSVYLHADR